MEWPSKLDPKDMVLFGKEAVLAGYRLYAGGGGDLERLVFERCSIYFYESKKDKTYSAVYHWDDENHYWRGSTAYGLPEDDK